MDAVKRTYDNLWRLTHNYVKAQRNCNQHHTMSSHSHGVAITMRLYSHPVTLTKTTYYFKNYEETNTGTIFPYKIHYIYTPDGLVAIMRQRRKTKTMYYVAKDHLGSILALFNADHTKVQENSFDAWGRRRNPSDWTYTNIPTPSITNRGFTTHEHLDDFALINMNGRIYDPVLGRFLSPDPFIQAPEFAQNFNRYSYVYNNPLKYVDPSGYSSIWPFRKWKHTYQKRIRREGAVWYGDEDVFNDPFGTDYIFYDGIGTSGGGGGASGPGGPGGGNGSSAGSHGGGGHGIGGITLPTGEEDGDPPRVINNSKNIIWFKPDDDYTDEDGKIYKEDQAYPIMPGHWTTVPIDGISIDGEVFKITNLSLLVVVNDDGSYDVLYGDPFTHTWNEVRGGSLSESLGPNWDELFNH